MNLLPIHKIYLEKTDLWVNTPNITKWFSDTILDQNKIDEIASIIFIRIEEIEHNYITLGELNLQNHMGIKDYSLYLKIVTYIVSHVNFIRSQGYGNSYSYSYGFNYNMHYDDHGKVVYTDSNSISYIIGSALEEIILYVLKTMFYYYSRK